jgi:LuxR family transcriptional regulator, maltose regulon positive regulatory protein
MAVTSATDEGLARSAPGVLLSTKLHRPEGRSSLIPRRALVELVGAEPLPKLVLVGAPPGWGKTTIVSEWCASADNHAFAWVSLDPDDNDPVRFWAYVTEALDRAEPGIGAGAIRLLGAPGVKAVDALLPTLINRLAEAPLSLVLVLDDYHVIQNEEIHEAIRFLLDHVPRSLRLVIATRSDPPLQLPRLRARGDLTEIRSDDLRFSPDEAAALLNDALGLGLSTGDIARLRERTEGWAAGLYLAALSLQGRADAAEFIRAFAGDDRHVVDYLGAEVIDRQPREIRTFLVRTSILERLSGPLCDAVTEGSSSSEMLEEIERSNLFLAPLDAKREWYRYHHLFGELLRYELDRAEPDLAPLLHRRAFHWYREEGFVAEAVHHATAAGEVAAAADLISAHWSAFLQRGQLETVAAWLDALPVEAVRSDPRLCLTRAWIGVNTGRLDEVGHWVGAAERASRRGGQEVPSFEAAAGMLRCIERYMEGDVGRAIDSARQAQELERVESPPWRSVGCPVLGISLFWSGAATDAQATLEEAMERARPAGNHLALIHALGCLATMSAEQGELDAAERRSARAEELWEEHDLGEHWATTMSHVARGKVLEQRGRLAAAAAEIGRGVELASAGVASIEIGYSLLSLAQVRHDLGDHDGARTLAQGARRVVEQCSDPGVLVRMLAQTERRLRVRRDGDAAAAELTDRELAVLRLLDSELSQREIGSALYVSLNTVKTHTKSIFRKLAVSTRTEAVARARERGLV